VAVTTCVPRALIQSASDGITKWFSGDVYTVKATAANTNRSLGAIDASVPPGGGPVPHTHPGHDEIFYLLSGELEFLSAPAPAVNERRPRRDRAVTNGSPLDRAGQVA
jgi:quercetin dioxygenase-like cupin family protein